jgi:hypothetical protein
MPVTVFLLSHPDENVLSLDRVNFNKLVTYDSRFFPVLRKNFLDGWIRMPESHGLAFAGNGGLSGYGVIRRCRRGFKVAPLFADDETV